MAVIEMVMAPPPHLIARFQVPPPLGDLNDGTFLISFLSVSPAASNNRTG